MGNHIFVLTVFKNIEKYSSNKINEGANLSHKIRTMCLLLQILHREASED